MKKQIFALSLVIFFGSALNSLAVTSITSLNGLTAATQTFTNDRNIQINSPLGGSVHNLVWANSLSVARGGTGLKSLTSGQLLFGDTAASMSSSVSLFWNKNTNHLGIGNNSPDSTLDVTGSILASGSGDVDVTLRSASNLSKFTLRTNSTTGGRLDILDQSSTLVSVLASGSVGLGITAPNYRLDVVGKINASNAICIAGDCRTVWPSSGIQSLGGQSGTAQTFANDTNVTISSAANVHTLGWSGVLAVSRGGLGVGSLADGQLLFGSSTKASQSSALFWDSSNKRLGISTSTPAYKLDVNGQVNASGGLCINGDCKTSWPTASSGGGVQGSGTSNYISKFSDTSTISNSSIYDNGSAVGVGTASVSGTSTLYVEGLVQSNIGGFKFPDGTVQVSKSTKTVFASWQGVSSDGTATTDGFISASCTGSSIEIEGDTLLHGSGGSFTRITTSSGNTAAAIVFPVRSGEDWHVALVSGSLTSCSSRFLPIVEQ